MDCNKDEATRAKEIAEKKFSAKDITGARKFALKAQALFPGLEGVPQMLSTLDVYTSADKKVNGEPDWYGVLGVDHKSDEETVRRQYRKLALMLHPDKNKSVGAEGAFKLISEAWTLLSDRAKRTAYDQQTRKGSKPPTTKPPKSSRGANPSNPPPSTSSSPAPGHRHHKQRPNTFWTVCHACKMQYEYLRVYLNHNLLCPNCHEPFLAKETGPPSSPSAATWNFSEQKKRQRGKKGEFRWASSSASQAAKTVQKAYERVKREREEAEALDAARMRETEALRKRRKLADDESGSNVINVRVVVERAEKNASSSRGFSLTEVQASLIEKAKREIRKKLDELQSVNSKPEVKPELVERPSREIRKKLGKNSKPEVRPEFVERPSRETPVEEITVTVPDPDFHDFDGDRTGSSFETGQIWATYDRIDGMPRYYAMVRGVVSTDPFEIRIARLSPGNEGRGGESGLLNWIASGFPKTCGDFFVGKRSEVNSSLNSFSHRVRWSKGEKGIIRIRPRKGQVWALFRNWSPEWNELTTDEVVRSYDLVEVVADEDDDEVEGLTVAPLVKVAGFRTVFHRHLDQKQVWKIPRGEIFRFSHRVPSRVLTGREAPDALRGCWELDPAATPLELLEVIPDVKEEEDIGGKVEADSDVVIIAVE